jgi:hypothetical protein
MGKSVFLLITLHPSPITGLIKLDLNVHAGRQFQLHQGVHGLVRGVQDVHKALVGADFVLIPGVLIDVGRNQDRKTLHFGRQGDGTAHIGAGSLRRVDDFLSGRIDQAVIEGLKVDADVLIRCHGFNL